MNIRHIEALARKTLASEPAKHPLPASAIDDDGEFSAVAPSKSGGAARTFILPRSQARFLSYWRGSLSWALPSWSQASRCGSSLQATHFF